MSRLLPLHDVHPQRWRNGGGLTRELLAWPSPNDWQVRVSVADIDVDGPFSPYADVERWFTVLQGKGVDLVIDGRSTRLVRGDPPIRFDGTAEACARLVDGPTRDLNLMLRGASGSIQCATDGLVWSPKAAQCGLFTAVDGICESEGLEGIEVPAYALLWFDAAPQAMRFTAAQRPAALIGWWLAATPHRG
jgi:uncharacterized protein